MSDQPSVPEIHIPNLSIGGFRGIADLSISRLGHVTLIAGGNNSGKTSILEAVRLLTDGAAPEVIRDILQLREENVEGLSYDRLSPDGDNFLVSALFHGFPEISDVFAPIRISSHHETRQVLLKVEWFQETLGADGSARLIPISDELNAEYEIVPALVVLADRARRIYPIDRINRLTSARRPSIRRDADRARSRFVNSSSTERTELLGPLWDNIALTDREPYVLEALRIIDPEISAVSMVGERSIRQSRTAVVRSGQFSRRVPLRSFGDGMNRLFGIILSLVNVNDSVLLVDEFENGLHFSVQLNVWRMIFSLVRQLNVQVVATTHSLDCVLGFAQAAAEHSTVEGLLVRIDRIDDHIRVIEYGEEDLQIAARQRIEVR